MTTCSNLAEYEWLTGDEAGAILEELAAATVPLHTIVQRLRGRLTPNQTHLLLEQAELRSRARAKFSQANRMFFTRVGLEQATDEWIARYKASRFSSQRAGLLGTHRGESSPTPLIVDLCCGVGGDLLSLSEIAETIGIDRDRVSAHFAQKNTGASTYAKDITDFDFDGVTAWHIDPDRRPNARRTTSLEWCEPNREAIERLLERVPHAAIKLAPATEVPAEWADGCELEWISRDRECRQQVAWHGELATAPGQHRATIVPTACGSAPYSLTGQPKLSIAISGKPDRYIFDIDPAVLASKLKGALAAEHDLLALGAGPTYLTGPNPIDAPPLTCFEIDEVAPFDVRKLAQQFRSRNIGKLEIKKRGVEVDPERLRRELKLRGPNQATLLITPIAGRPTAILAHRV